MNKINANPKSNLISHPNLEPNLNQNDKIHARFLLQRPDTDLSTFLLDVDLIIPSKGITVIFGQSGSGKTTLLRCVAGLERAKAGYLTVNGEVWQSSSLFLPTHKRPLGYVFQESSLFAHLTGQGNLDYARKRSGVANSQVLYEQVIALMGIKPILQRYPNQLSGGERQRIAIARALLIQPRLLLMDEPLASLDFSRKQEILPYLEKLRTSFDIPILYVSHSMDEVARLADHVVLLQHGKMVAQGNTNEVFSRINLPLPVGNDASVVWHGQVVERDKKWHLARVATDGGDLWVHDINDEIGQQVRVRIQARDVSLSLACHEDSSILNRLSVKVVEIETKGNLTEALVRLIAGSDYIIARLTRRSIDHLKLKQGTQLWAQIKSVAIVR